MTGVTEVAVVDCVIIGAGPAGLTVAAAHAATAATAIHHALPPNYR